MYIKSNILGNVKKIKKKARKTKNLFLSSIKL